MKRRPSANVIFRRPGSFLRSAWVSVISDSAHLVTDIVFSEQVNFNRATYFYMGFELLRFGSAVPAPDQ